MVPRSMPMALFMMRSKPAGAGPTGERKNTDDTAQADTEAARGRPRSRASGEIRSSQARSRRAPTSTVLGLPPHIVTMLSTKSLDLRQTVSVNSSGSNQHLNDICSQPATGLFSPPWIRRLKAPEEGNLMRVRTFLFVMMSALVAISAEAQEVNRQHHRRSA